MGKTVLKLVPVTYEPVESSGAAIYRYGNMRMLRLPTMGTNDTGWILTVSERDAPSTNVTAFGTVYNGSEYKTIVITVHRRDSTYANRCRVTISDTWGASVSGAQLSFIQPKTLTYLID